MKNGRTAGGSRRRIWLVAAPAALAVAAMIVGHLAPEAPLWWDVAWTAAAVSALSGTLVGRRAASSVNRVHWTMWAAASMCWLAGQAGWDAFSIVSSDRLPASPNVADVGWWAFAILMILSLVRMRTRSRALLIVGAAEVLPVIAAAASLTFALLWHDASASMLPVAQRLSALVYPALYVSAAVLALQALIGGALTSVRSAGARVVLAGVMLEAAAFIMWSQQLLNQTYVSGASLLDPVWVIGLVTIGFGGVLAANRAEPAAPAAEEPGLRGGILPAGLFVVLLGALLRARLEHAPNAVAYILYAGLMFCGGSMVVRGTLLERRLRGMLTRERSALANLADREAELARLNEQLKEDSRRDPLTGMRNRRALADELPGLEAGHRERGQPLAIALCDVDRFKLYNDELGHLAGDQALRAIAATIRGSLRGKDMAYRFGGEELLIVLPDTTAEEALVAMERLRAAVEAAALPHPAGIGGILTVSIGVAAGHADYGSLLAHADSALYSAKRDGRNRVAAAAESARGPALARDRAGGGADHGMIPRHLRGMLALSRIAASGAGVLPVLEALAGTIRSELSFQVVAINLLDDTGETMQVMLVEGDEEARQTLLGSSSGWAEWAALMTPERMREGALWVPAGTYEWEDETAVWTPPAAAAPEPDAWHPEDMLMLPLRGAADQILGMVSLDQPLHGQRPEDAEISVLMAVAGQAGLAVEQAHRTAAGGTGASSESAELRLAAVMLLAETLDMRDAGTARHSRTVGEYARQTALALGLAEDRVERIHAAGVLHDLGKLGIADAILHKPGRLDDAEWREIMRHPEIGARILEHAGMPDIAGWVRAHHERLDGGGYPRGTVGDQIPLEARILAVADAYEAMVADRPYRAGVSGAVACAELTRCSGSQFDPAVVDAFIGALESGTGGTPLSDADGSAFALATAE
ncbi:MAG TPA: diguanylate cyclase [Solirubrobacteraceae bacterium]|nr:diguanylate cyclase [Solirubrobacteraceae bacterium]